MNANDRSIVGLVMIAHAMVHTYEMSIPILVTSWLVEFDVSTSVMGVVVTIGYALFGIGGLPAGVLADAYSSRRLIAICLLGMGGSFLALGVAPNVAVVGLALLFWGVAASVYHPAGLSLISTGVEERGNAFAYHGMAGNIGLALGPFAALILLLFFDWRIVVAVLAVPAALAAASALYLDVDETAAATAANGDGRSERGEDDSDVADDDFPLSEFLADSRVLFAGGFLMVFWIVIFYGLFYRSTLTFMPELLSGFALFEPIEILGETFEAHDLFYVFVLVAGVFGQYVAGKFAARFSTEYGMTGTFVLLVLVSLAFVPAANAGVWPLVVVGAALGICLFAAQPLYQTLVAEYTPAGTRGLSYGYTYAGLFGVGALGATVAGALLEFFSVARLFVVLAALAAVTLVIAFVLTYFDRVGALTW